MYVDFTEKGELSIVPENLTEYYALKVWQKNPDNKVNFLTDSPPIEKSLTVPKEGQVYQHFKDLRCVIEEIAIASVDLEEGDTHYLPSDKQYIASCQIKKGETIVAYHCDGSQALHGRSLLNFWTIVKRPRFKLLNSVRQPIEYS